MKLHDALEKCDRLRSDNVVLKIRFKQKADCVTVESYFQVDRILAKALLLPMGTKFTDAEAYLYSYVTYAPRETMTNGKLICLNVGSWLRRRDILSKRGLDFGRR